MSGIDKAEINRRASVIVGECGGIHAPHEVFYIRSIAYSAGRARDAFLRFDVARTIGDTADYQVSAIHEALGHAASVMALHPSGFWIVWNR